MGCAQKRTPRLCGRLLSYVPRTTWPLTARQSCCSRELVGGWLGGGRVVKSRSGRSLRTRIRGIASLRSFPHPAPARPRLAPPTVSPLLQASSLQLPLEVYYFGEVKSRHQPTVKLMPNGGGRYPFVVAPAREPRGRKACRQRG